VKVTLINDEWATASVPSGLPFGIDQALDPPGSLRAGVLNAIKYINTVLDLKLMGESPIPQDSVDKLLVKQLKKDVQAWGLSNHKLGSNVIMAVSIAVCKAAAYAVKTPIYRHIAELAGYKNVCLPVPANVVINGGSLEENKLAIRGFTILSIGAPSFNKAVSMNGKAYRALKNLLEENYDEDATDEGLDGGCAPDIQNIQEGLELLKTIISETNLKGKIVIGVDAAASEFYAIDTYNLSFKEEDWDAAQEISGDVLKDIYKLFVKEYPIVSLEDPFDNEDWENYTKLTSEIGQEVQIMGADLLVTHPKRIEQAIKKKTCNTLLLKMNELGTVSECIRAARRAKLAEWGLVCVSNGSAEMGETFIADLSVGLAADQIKIGAHTDFGLDLVYQQLNRIERELGSEAVYAGSKFIANIKPS
ncbi:hypothetical protein UlMin_005338, partial [Ulmus minor]